MKPQRLSSSEGGVVSRVVVVADVMRCLGGMTEVLWGKERTRAKGVSERDEGGCSDVRQRLWIRELGGRRLKVMCTRRRYTEVSKEATRFQR